MGTTSLSSKKKKIKYVLQNLRIHSTVEKYFERNAYNLPNQQAGYKYGSLMLNLFNIIIFLSSTPIPVPPSHNSQACSKRGKIYVKQGQRKAWRISSPKN
jgi:hypothetical protein